MNRKVVEYETRHFYDAPEFFANEVESYRRTGRLMVADNGLGPELFFEYEISGPAYDDPEHPGSIWWTVGTARSIAESYEQELT